MKHLQICSFREYYNNQMEEALFKDHPNNQMEKPLFENLPEIQMLGCSLIRVVSHGSFSSQWSFLR